MEIKDPDIVVNVREDGVAEIWVGLGYDKIYAMVEPWGFLRKLRLVRPIDEATEIIIGKLVERWYEGQANKARSFEIKASEISHETHPRQLPTLHG